MTATHVKDQDGDRLPEAGAGFFWDTCEHGSGTYPVLRPRTDACAAVFTTRVGGVSLEPFDRLNVSMSLGDHPFRVIANRDLAARPIGADAFWSTTKQVHRGDVVAAHRMGRHREADAQWTDDPDQTLAVLSADCVLLLLVGATRVGVAHAGWRGLLAGVIENAVVATEATEVFAGPAIGPCCFEVGQEVIGSFAARHPAAVTDDRHVDLWVAAEAAAVRGGAKVVHSARICTSCHPDLFFSHRQQQGQTGRQALVARLL